MEFLDAIDKSLEEDDKASADALLDETNLFNSLKNMKHDKTPGMSGLTTEWYLHFGPTLKTIFWSV